MFTGIVQNTGTIVALHRKQKTATLRIKTDLTDDGSKVGDSVAIDGICLTITDLAPGWFETTAMPETIRRTNLAAHEVGAQVDLELALAANSRIDGHFVLGHIDMTSTLMERVPDQNAVVMRFELPSGYQRFVVEKGSIAINGVSLTVIAVDNQSFSVSLIPYTLAQTTLGKLVEGQQVNIETDIIGKYIVRLKEAE